MRVSIFGLGHIGAVAGACLADAGHEVIAVDADAAKVRCIHEARAPVIEPGLDAMIHEAVSKGRLRATTDSAEAVLASDISLICAGMPDIIDYVRTACSQIGVALKKKHGFHSIVLRGDVAPGIAHSVAIPVLEDCSGGKAGADFGFASNPAFLREGTAIYDYFHPPKIVIGTIDDRTAKALAGLYKGINAPFDLTGIEAAEVARHADRANLLAFG